MLTKGMDFYVQIPQESNARVLHPATITDIDPKSQMLSGDILLPTAALHEGDEIRVYFDRNRDFMQQPASVTAVLGETPLVKSDNVLDDSARLKLAVNLQTQGEPVSAESRQSYRVSTISAKLTAQLGLEAECPLLDISATGFSVISTEDHDLGAQKPVDIIKDGNRFTGAACIQSKRTLSRNRIRYGLHSIEDKKLGGNLMLGMQTFSMLVQRQQLQRLSGAA